METTYKSKKFNSHFISQLLLRRFCVNGKLNVHNKISGYTRKIKPDETAFLSVHEDLFKKIEYKFHQIETRAATAFQSLDNGNLFNNQKDIDSIKSLMTLHYVRSAAFLTLFTQHSEKYFKELIEKAKKEHPEKLSEIEKDIPLLKKHWEANLVKLMPDSLKGSIKKVGDYVNEFDIEIGVSSSDVQFLLADIPTLNIGDNGKIGILAGIGITNSKGFILPLSPKYIAALTGKNKSKGYIQLNLSQVGSANSKMLSQCLFEYYTAL